MHDGHYSFTRDDIYIRITFMYPLYRNIDAYKIHNEITH